jgi:hypothetical protein
MGLARFLKPDELPAVENFRHKIFVFFLLKSIHLSITSSTIKSSYATMKFSTASALSFFLASSASAFSPAFAPRTRVARSSQLQMA